MKAFTYLLKIHVQVTLCIVELTNSSYRRDLVVIIYESLKYSSQCGKAVLLSNIEFGIINRTSNYKSKDIF